MEVLQIANKDLFFVEPVDKKLLTTLNADIYRILRRNPSLKDEVYKNYVCIDGRPIHAIARTRAADAQLVQGSSLIFDLASYAAKVRAPMLIIGGRPEVNATAVKNLTDVYGCEVFGYAPDKIDAVALQAACALILEKRIKYAFICLGAPRQEMLALEIMKMLPEGFPILIIGAGGSVDFAAAAIRRAPRILQILYLEGVYRLVKEPTLKRMRRLATSLWGLSLFGFDVVTKKLIVCSHR
jgi:N-acetylglucosaminyldiphosphoundecaprenol N-acetyl-beta-D-mannosaminyltransferase